MVLLGVCVRHTHTDIHTYVVVSEGVWVWVCSSQLVIPQGDIQCLCLVKRSPPLCLVSHM